MRMIRISKTVRCSIPLALLFVLMLVCSPAHPQSFSIEAFAAEPTLDSPDLSPRGDRYAARLSISGETYLSIRPVHPDGPKALNQPIGEKNELLGWAWVNDDWLVVTLASTVKVQEEDFRIRRAFGLSAANGKLVPIARDMAAQNGADILWVAHDGTPRILLAVQRSIYFDDPGFYPEVFEVDVSTGKMLSKVKPQVDVMDWYADGRGVVRMGVGYNDLSRTYRLLYRDEDRTPFRTIDRARTREHESLLVPALFLAEAGKALAYDDSDGFDALYELDLHTLKLGSRFFGVDGYDIGGFSSDPTRTRITGISVTDTYHHVRWLDPELAELQDSLDKAVGPEMRATIVSMNADQSKLMVFVGSANSPGRYYFFNRKVGVMQLLAHVNPTMKGARLHPVSTIGYKARDGLAMTAVLTLPKGREAKKLPLIVLPHGGPAARDEEEWDWWSQYLAQLGYAVIKPNYRGSTGFGTAFKDKGDSEWGLGMQDDLLDAIDHLAASGIADPARVCISGASYGGYAALRGAQRDGSRYRCAISYAGVSDIAGMLRYDSHFLNSGRRHDYRKRVAPDYKQVSPLNFAAQFSVPVLIMHGARDLTVPVQQSRSMARKLESAGKQVRYVEQKLADHHFSRSEDRLEFLREMTDFLARYNPADPPPAAPAQ